MIKFSFLCSSIILKVIGDKKRYLPVWLSNPFRMKFYHIKGIILGLTVKQSK